jgi:hypothetical protein
VREGRAARLGSEPTKHPSKEKSPTVGHFIDDDANRSSIANGAVSSGDLSARNQKHPGADSKASKSLTPLTAQYHKFAVPSPWLKERITVTVKHLVRAMNSGTVIPGVASCR